MLAFDWLAACLGYGGRRCLGGRGAPARRRPWRQAVAVAAKWLLVGRIKAGEHPLWSSFIWRNEVVDTFIEMVSRAVVRARRPREHRRWCGGCGPRRKIGRGTWCESYWLPEADLVDARRRLDGQPRLRGPDPPVP